MKSLHKIDKDFHRESQNIFCCFYCFEYSHEIHLRNIRKYSVCLRSGERPLIEMYLVEKIHENYWFLVNWSLFETEKYY